jgi:hypothetical protein
VQEQRLQTLYGRLTIKQLTKTHLGSRVDREFELGLLAVIDGQPLHEEGGEAGAGASAEGVEDEEALESGALLGELSDAVKDQVNDLLA